MRSGGGKGSIGGPADGGASRFKLPLRGSRDTIPSAAPAPVLLPPDTLPADPPALRRETGVVSAIKDSFGFIRCADREGNLFFHFRSIRGFPESPPLFVGSEVGFSVGMDRDGRPHAVDVEQLPPGTVVFEIVSPEPRLGVIADIPSVPSVSSRDEACGHIILIERLDDASFVDVSDEKYAAYYVEFKRRELVKPGVFLAGDVVEFNIYTEKSSGRQGACNIKLVKPGGQREEGIVTSTKESYGFIARAMHPGSQIFFHFSEILNGDGTDPTGSVPPGTCVEFSVKSSEKGQANATRVVILPEGSVKPRAVSDSVVLGVIVQGIIHRGSLAGTRRKNSRASSKEMGKIRYDGSQDTTLDITKSIESIEDSLTASGILGFPDEIVFLGMDLLKPNIQLFEGDIVAFRVSQDARSKSRFAVDVKLVAPRAEGRIAGVVAQVKQNYGFVQVKDREAPMFFHFNEFFEENVKTPDSSSPVSGFEGPSIGDIIEFDIGLDGKGEETAIRLKVIGKQAAPSTTDADTPLPIPVIPGVILLEKIQGRVVLEPDRSSSADWGALKETSEDPAPKEIPSLPKFTGIVAIDPNFKKLLSALSSKVSSEKKELSKDESIVSELFRDPESPVRLAFSRSDLVDSKSCLHEGDLVEFCLYRPHDVTPLGLDASTVAADVRAGGIILIPKQGRVVKSFGGKRGIIQVEGLSSTEQVSFSREDVIESKALNPGDTVLVNGLHVNPKNRGRRMAKRIQFVKAATLPESIVPTRSSGSSSDLSLPATTTEVLSPVKRSGAGSISRMARSKQRTAKGPDGTPGFPAGRGRPLTS